MTETGRDVPGARLIRERIATHPGSGSEGWNALATFDALLAVVEAAQQASALLTEAEAEATHGLTANPAYIALCIKQAQARLKPPLAALESQEESDDRDR